MVRIGEEGYMNATRDIIETCRLITAGIRQIPELIVLGEPMAMIVAFASDVVNVYSLNDCMSHRGWALNALQNPASVHICVTLRHVGRADEFLNDLKESLQELKVKPVTGGSAPLYGAVGSLPPGPVKDVLGRYLDIQYA
jgi:sphinganine-1-phosphate aldolase